MKQWDVIYEYNCYHVRPAARKSLRQRLVSSYALSLQQLLGFVFLSLGLGGILGPMIPTIRLETTHALRSWTINNKQEAIATLPPAVPVVVDPLVTPDGSSIAPASDDFALIVPKVGINAAVLPGVNPMRPQEYQEALKTGVAHASTSFYPDEDGTVYLFSHSTNYDWFVSDLNAVFYLLKNLDRGDAVVIIYKGKRYTYEITGKKVVSPTNTTYLYPYVGQRNLVLQTCWPPGSVAQRLLIFANLVEEQGKKI